VDQEVLHRVQFVEHVEEQRRVSDEGRRGRAARGRHLVNGLAGQEEALDGGAGQLVPGVQAVGGVDVGRLGDQRVALGVGTAALQGMEVVPGAFCPSVPAEHAGALGVLEGAGGDLPAAVDGRVGVAGQQQQVRPDPGAGVLARAGRGVE